MAQPFAQPAEHRWDRGLRAQLRWALTFRMPLRSCQGLRVSLVAVFAAGGSGWASPLSWRWCSPPSALRSFAQPQVRALLYLPRRGERHALDPVHLPRAVALLRLVRLPLIHSLR